MITKSLNELKVEIEQIFPRALAILTEELDQRYNSAIEPLDREATALTEEYAAITAEAQKLAAVLPSLSREAQREADRLVLAGDHVGAEMKLAEVQEAEKAPLAMQKRQKEISDRYDLIPGEKVAIAGKLFEQMYREMQAVVRLAETGFLVCLLDGLVRAAGDFQQRTGCAQNLLLQQNRMMGLTADGQSPEWTSAMRWYQSRR